MADSALAAAASSAAVGPGANSASQWEQNFTESGTSRPQLQHFIANLPPGCIDYGHYPLEAPAEEPIHNIKI
jgi:hypothetical protein